ncbi:MAG: Txe/YoeB family addiction module toxin [Ignavibacteria bacterium]|nr:Txe/YoeB family addiction module toxin [Ignavibacteria bacterium]
MKRIIFEYNAFEDFSNWAIVDKKIFLKIISLIKDIKRDPFKGIGKPEPLKEEFSGYWSRHIDDKHRLIYKFTENNIQIISCKGHY